MKKNNLFNSVLASVLILGGLCGTEVSALSNNSENIITSENATMIDGNVGNLVLM